MVYVLPSGANGGVGNNLNNNGTCSNTGANFMDICSKISFALTSSCDTLVNPDNTLTSQGTHVRNCIEGGAALDGAAILLGTAPTTIVPVLPSVAQLGGCGDVVTSVS